MDTDNKDNRIINDNSADNVAQTVTDGDGLAREAMESGEPARGFNRRKLVPRVFFRICAVLGLLCAVAAWLLLYHQPEVAVAAGCAGVCISILGLWSGKGCLRFLSVTALVASVVLVLVYVAFYWGIAWSVSHL